MSDLVHGAYLAADSVRRRRRAEGIRTSIDAFAAMVSRAFVALKRMRSIRRVQENRDRNSPDGRYGEWIDLGGEA